MFNFLLFFRLRFFFYISYLIFLYAIIQIQNHYVPNTAFDIINNQNIKKIETYLWKKKPIFIHKYIYIYIVVQRLVYVELKI